jgi:hypothetical protein
MENILQKSELAVACMSYKMHSKCISALIAELWVVNIGAKSFCSSHIVGLHVQTKLELVCCKKRQKIVFWPVKGLENKGPLKVLNGTKLILDIHENNLDSFRISLKYFRSFRGPLLHKPVTGQELFFAISYSKPALVKTSLDYTMKQSGIVYTYCK